MIANDDDETPVQNPTTQQQQQQPQQQNTNQPPAWLGKPWYESFNTSDEFWAAQKQYYESQVNNPATPLGQFAREQRAGGDANRAEAAASRPASYGYNVQPNSTMIKNPETGISEPQRPARKPEQEPVRNQSAYVEPFKLRQAAGADNYGKSRDYDYWILDSNTPTVVEPGWTGGEYARTLGQKDLTMGRYDPTRGVFVITAPGYADPGAMGTLDKFTQVSRWGMPGNYLIDRDLRSSAPKSSPMDNIMPRAGASSVEDARGSPLVGGMGQEAYDNFFGAGAYGNVLASEKPAPQSSNPFSATGPSLSPLTPNGRLVGVETQQNDESFVITGTYNKFTQSQEQKQLTNKDAIAIGVMTSIGMAPATRGAANALNALPGNAPIRQFVMPSTYKPDSEQSALQSHSMSDPYWKTEEGKYTMRNMAVTGAVGMMPIGDVKGVAMGGDALNYIGTRAARVPGVRAISSKANVIVTPIRNTVNTYSKAYSATDYALHEKTLGKAAIMTDDAMNKFANTRFMRDTTATFNPQELVGLTRAEQKTAAFVRMSPNERIASRVSSRDMMAPDPYNPAYIPDGVVSTGTKYQMYSRIVNRDEMAAKMAADIRLNYGLEKSGDFFNRMYSESSGVRYTRVFGLPTGSKPISTQGVYSPSDVRYTRVFGLPTGSKPISVPIVKQSTYKAPDMAEASLMSMSNSMKDRSFSISSYSSSYTPPSPPSRFTDVIIPPPSIFVPPPSPAMFVPPPLVWPGGSGGSNYLDKKGVRGAGYYINIANPFMSATPSKKKRKGKARHKK